MIPATHEWRESYLRERNRLFCTPPIESSLREVCASYGPAIRSLHARWSFQPMDAGITAALRERAGDASEYMRDCAPFPAFGCATCSALGFRTCILNR